MSYILFRQLKLREIRKSDLHVIRIIRIFVNQKLKKMVTTIKKGTSSEKIRLALKKRPVNVKSIDLKKYCGSISLDQDPLEMQKKWRDEWE